MNLTSSDILAVAQSLPMTTQLFAQVAQLLREADVSLDDVARLIRTDAVASFRVLQGANGVLYGLREPCSDVESAVQRLGGREINRLLGAIAAQQMGAAGLVFHGVTGAQLRDNALRCALGAEWLVQRLDPENAPSAYAAGILRSVGKVALTRASLRQGGGRVLRPAGQLLPSWERELWGLDSAAAGAILLSSWRLPAVLVAGVAEQFDAVGAKPTEGNRHGVITWAVQLAAQTADRSGWGMPGETGCWPTAEDLCVLRGEDASELTPDLCAAVDAQMERLQTVMGDAA